MQTHLLQYSCLTVPAVFRRMPCPSVELQFIFLRDDCGREGDLAAYLY